MVFLTAYKIHEVYLLLKSSHKDVYDKLYSHLATCTVLLSVFLICLANYLNYYPIIDFYGRLLRFSPLYIVIFSTFAIFLYLLPGLSDPEINTTKRLPFLGLNYFIFFILWLNYICLNGIEVFSNGSSGLVVLFPAIFVLSVHLVTVLSELEDNKSEFMITTATLLELILLSLEWNDSILIRLTIALMTWIYVYYCWLYKIRVERNQRLEQSNNTESLD